MTFKLISIDIFQTLTDVSSIQEDIMRKFLGDNYTPALSKIGWNLASEKILEYFSEHIAENTTFVTVKTIFALCYSEVFRQLNIDFDPEEAANISAYHHNYVAPFADAEIFLDHIQNKYTYCISSDADNDMIQGLHILKNSDMVFTSESLKTYKMSKDNLFFKTILDHYQVHPHEMIHIGDSPADIINPKRLGIQTCWINRNQANWQNEIEPDYIFTNLEQLTSII